MQVPERARCEEDGGPSRMVTDRGPVGGQVTRRISRVSQSAEWSDKPGVRNR
ncbi:unnamed protein product, partial [Staurois parvus]